MLHIHTSTVRDGSMKSVHSDDTRLVDTNRAAFLVKHDIQPTDTTLVRLEYGRSNYCEYYSLTSADKGDGIARISTIISDALVVTEPHHALFLPLADCIGAVIHDTAQNILMLSHLGRHNLEQFGGTKCIEYLVARHGCDPQNLTAWLSPAAGKKTYPLYAFDNRSLHDVATEQITAAGIPAANITASPIDSATDPDYFSHSQFLASNQANDGRFAVVAKL